MRELEEQIRDLADATFAKTQPVQRPVGRNRRRTGWLYGAAAAVIVAVVITSAIVVRSPDENRVATSEGVAHLTIDDSLSIDLDELVERSDQYRLRNLGPLLTYDFDALGSDWEATLLHAITTASPSRAGRTEYWQQTRVQTPTGHRVVVNVQGPLEPGDTATTLPATQTPTEPLTIRGEPGRAGSGWIEWIEQDRVATQIVPAPGTTMSVQLRREMIELAERLEALEVPQLQWSTPESAGTPMADSTARLAGVLGGTTWEVVSSPDGRTSLAVNDRLASSLGPSTAGAEVGNRQIDLNLGPISVPGGTLAWGTAPSTVIAVRLTLANGDTARVATVESTAAQSLFAVPIADELDPISLEFLDTAGGIDATYSLTWLPPYIGGSISTTVPVK